MSKKSIYKMSIKILQLCLAVILTFKEFAAIYTYQRRAIVKIAVINKILV